MGAAADFAQGDRVPDFLLGDVGVKRHLGAVEHDQQLGFPGLQAKQGLIEVIEAEGSAENAIEARFEAALGLGGRGRPIELEVVIEPCLPIRLTQTPTTCWVRPIAGVEFSVGRRLSPARDPQQ